MYVINLTDVKITSNDYDNRTNNETSCDILIPTLLSTKPCGLSFLFLMSLIIYTLIKPLLR